MKTIAHYAARMKRPAFYTAVLLVMMSSVQQQSYASSPVPLFKDSIFISKLLVSKKYKIKIYPGASNEVLFFNASGEDGKVYELFLFDVDGNMVKQAQVRNKQTTILTNFNKGCYTFEVFSDDEHIENGTLTIR